MAELELELLDVFVRFPLARFSVYTQVQQQVLSAQAARIQHLLDQALSGGTVQGPVLNDVHGQFWLWTLGAYEVVRTMDQHAACFDAVYASKVGEFKRWLVRLRVPFAKQELAGLKNSQLSTEASIAKFDFQNRDFAFDVRGELYWVREAIGRFLALMTGASVEVVLQPMHGGRN